MKFLAKKIRKVFSDKVIKNIYDINIVICSILSLMTLFLDYVPGMDINRPPYSYVDSFTLAVFTVDYFGRMIIADDKIAFVKNNIFDLLAIIPFSSIFGSLRLVRAFSILPRFAIFLRFVGIAGRFAENLKRFLKVNGLIYLIIVSTIVLVTAAISYSLAEHVSIANAFWWAIVTATTVGYGDISPHTFVGRAASIALMLIGIGIVGTLTSSISSFFNGTGNDQDKKIDKILENMTELKKENEELNKKIDKLQEQKDDKTNNQQK